MIRCIRRAIDVPLGRRLAKDVMVRSSAALSLVGTSLIVARSSSPSFDDVVSILARDDTFRRRETDDSLPRGEHLNDLLLFAVLSPSFVAELVEEPVRGEVNETLMKALVDGGEVVQREVGILRGQLETLGRCCSGADGGGC
jgi:hypothetical protein